MYLKQTTGFVLKNGRNPTPPDRQTFEGWNIHRRHTFILKDLGSRKKLAKRMWSYLMYPKADMCIRVKLNHRREIERHEVYSMAEGMELADQTEMAIAASNRRN